MRLAWLCCFVGCFGLIVVDCWLIDCVFLGLWLVWDLCFGGALVGCRRLVWLAVMF